MSRRVLERRGTTEQHQTFVGAPGEITVDTDKNTIVVHDGVTAGGYPLAKASDIGDSLTIDLATETTDGLMSAADKVKLNGLNPYPTAADRVAGPRVITTSGTRLIVNGRPIREIGITAKELLVDFLVSGDTSFLRDIPLIAQHGFRYLKVAGLPYWAADWTATYNADLAGMHNKIRAFLDFAASYNLGIVIDLFWNHQTQTDLLGTPLAAAYENTSSTMYTNITSILNDYITRYKDHSAVAAWEIGTNYNYYSTNGEMPMVNTDKGTAASYTSADVLTQTGLTTFFTQVANIIRGIDTSGRIVIAGNQGPDFKGFDDTDDYINNSLVQDSPTVLSAVTSNRFPTQLLSVRRGNSLYNFLVKARKKAALANKPFILSAFGTTVGEHNGALNEDVMQTFAQAIKKSGTQLSFLYNWKRDVNVVDTDYSIHPDNTENNTDKNFVKVRDVNDSLTSEYFVDAQTPNVNTKHTIGGQNALVPSSSTNTMLEAAIYWKFAMNPSTLGSAISLWFKLDEVVTEEKVICSQINPRGNIGYTIGIDADSKVFGRFAFRNGDVTRIETIRDHMPAQVIADGWVHYSFQMVADDTNPFAGITAYRNGERVSYQAIGAREYDLPSSIPFSIFAENIIDNGSTNQVGFFNPVYGGIRDIRIYDRPLTDEEYYNVYMYNVAPGETENILIELNGSLAVTGQNGAEAGTADLTVTYGTGVTYETFTE